MVCPACSFQRDSLYRTCHLCSLENPRGVQDMSYLFIRESKRGTGHVVFFHSKENPSGVQDMLSLLIFKENPSGVQDMMALLVPKRIQDRCRTCCL